ALHRSKRTLLLWGTTLIPLGLLAANVVTLFLGGVPDWARSLLGGLLFFGTPVTALGAWFLFAFSLMFSRKQRRLTRWRKSLAALMCVVQASRASDGTGSQPPTRPITGAARLVHGGVDLLLEDDDLFSLHLQRFLSDHQVPCAVPLYDEQGRYLFALPEKI